ncbi:MAG: transposase [Verrucomicrobiota bacterium]
MTEAKPSATRRSEGGSADLQSASRVGDNPKPGVTRPSGQAAKPSATRRSGECGKPVAEGRSEDSTRSGASVVPYNPGLHQLVEGKNAWTEPLDEAAKEKGFRGWHQRGYLPHYDVPGITQFVTFRLADAMPASRRSEWEALCKIESERERRIQLEDYLDRGAGECWLARPKLADLTESALRHFDGERYGLQAWVVMPNHVHVLVDVWQTPLAAMVQSWKRFIAREANKLLKREGSFWEREYWDTWIRDEAHRQKAVRYVESNPVKAHLAAESTAWPWSSARKRDDFGRLRIPKAGLETGAPNETGAPSCTRLSL